MPKFFKRFIRYKSIPYELEFVSKLVSSNRKKDAVDYLQFLIGKYFE